MKRLPVFILLLSSVLLACNQQQPNDLKRYTGAEPIDSANAPILLFENSSHDFGTITQGDKVTYNFKFRNAGKSPLIITSASSSCGCTVPEPPKEPIAPGKTSVIKVVFNSAGKVGKIEKIVTINSNAVTAYANVFLTGEVNLPSTK